MHVDFWRKTNLSVLPDKDPGRARDVEPDTLPPEEEKDEERPIDHTRLEFLEAQPRVLLGFVNDTNGFRGYHGAVFPDRIVLEHPRFGNAAYVVPLEKPIHINESVFQKPPASRINEETARRLLEEVWGPISREAKSRRALRERFHARRVIHTPDTWQKRLQEAINLLPEERA